MAGAAALARPGEEYGNDERVEALWAIKAMEHAEVYFNLLCSVDPKLLKLSKFDEEIHQAFRKTFPGTISNYSLNLNVYNSHFLCCFLKT